LIPIHLISGEENRDLAIRRGARSFLLKPLENEALTELFEDIVDDAQKIVKKVLVVEDNEIDSSQIVKILGNGILEVTIASTGEQALKENDIKSFDCIILDYTLPDISGPDLLDKVASGKKKHTPVIVYSAKDFNK